MMRKTNELLRLAVFSDLHGTNSNRHYKTLPDGMSDLLHRQGLFVEHLASLDVDGYVNLGDTTDEEIVNPYVMGLLNDILIGRLARTGKMCIHLEGNHCIVDSGNVYSVLSSYQGKVSDNVRLTVSESDDIVIPVKGGSVYIRAVPYIGDYEKMREMISKPLDQAYNVCSILLYHAPTQQALMDNGIPANKGLLFQDEDLDQYDIALAGDFHRPQKFKVGNTPVYYCGAPFALTRGQDFHLGYRILSIFEDGSYSLEDRANPYAIRIVDLNFGSDEIQNLDPNRTALYINDVPFNEKKELVAQLDGLGFYSYKVKVAPVKKPEVLLEDSSERLRHHKFQDKKSLFYSILNEEEKRDEWVTELIDRISDGK